MISDTINRTTFKELIMGIKKKARSEKCTLYTNDYDSRMFEELEFHCLYIPEKACVCLCSDESELNRAYFYGFDRNALIECLRNVPREVLLDYIVKGQNEIESLFYEAGFSKIATYARKSIVVSKDDCQFKRSHSEILDQYYDESIGEIATEEDVKEIHDLLCSVFDWRKDHIPSYETIKELVEKRWMLIYRHRGRIQALYAYQIQGKKFYSNISYNALAAPVLYCLEKKAHEYVVNHYDIREKYSWIDITNKKSLRRNTLDFDDVYDMIYQKD